LASKLDSNNGQHHWAAPLGSTINTLCQQHSATPMVSTTGRHHWPGPLAARSKRVYDDDDADDVDEDDDEDDEDDDDHAHDVYDDHDDDDGDDGGDELTGDGEDTTEKNEKRNAVKHNKTQLCTNFVTSSPKDGPQHISLCCSTPQHQKRIWGKEGEGYQTLSKFQKQTRFCLIPCVRVSNLVHKSMKVFVWVRCGVQAILYVSHITHDLTSSVI